MTSENTAIPNQEMHRSGRGKRFGEVYSRNASSGSLVILTNKRALTQTAKATLVELASNRSYRCREQWHLAIPLSETLQRVFKEGEEEFLVSVRIINSRGATGRITLGGEHVCDIFISHSGGCGEIDAVVCHFPCGFENQVNGVSVSSALRSGHLNDVIAEAHSGAMQTFFFGES